MMRQEAQDYRHRVMQQYYSEGPDFLIKLLGHTAMRRYIICSDYRTNSAAKTARLHGLRGRWEVAKMCGKKNAPLLGTEPTKS